MKDLPRKIIEKALVTIKYETWSKIKARMMKFTPKSNMDNKTKEQNENKNDKYIS